MIKVEHSASSGFTVTGRPTVWAAPERQEVDMKFPNFHQLYSQTFERRHTKASGLAPTTV